MADQSTDETRGDEERLSRLSGGTSPPDDDAIIAEYEARYRPEPKRKSHPRGKPRSYSAQNLSDDERLWAAVAHGSVWVTFAAAAITSGISVPFVVFIPLTVYFLFRKRSDFVAFHALQAFALQLVGTIGALVLFIVGMTVWAIGLVIAIMLIALVVGVVLVPLWVLVGVILSVVTAVMPLVALILATIAAFQTYRGHDYRYPYVARWVDRQISGGLLDS